MPYRQILPYRRVPWSGVPLYLEVRTFPQGRTDDVSIMSSTSTAVMCTRRKITSGEEKGELSKYDTRYICIRNHRTIEPRRK